jgi:hypothetical protein
VLWWNEGRAVKTADGLTEGAGKVESVFSGDINPKYEGELIQIVDNVISDDTLIDYDFNVKSTGLKMKRKVEMYQWKEKKSDKKKKNLGGSETTTSTFDYATEWSEDLINSNNFEVQNQYINPSNFPIEQKDYQVENATIGAFDMPQNLISSLGDYKSINHKEFLSSNYDTVVSSSTIYIGKGSLNSPLVGDVKVTFTEVKEKKVSIISKQSGNTLVPYETENGSSISLLETGEVSPEKMFATAQSNNSTMTWILRAVGFFMMFFGISRIFNPLVILADVIPFLGSLLGAGIGLFSGVIAFMLSLITIGIAWVASRPLLGFSILGIGVIAFIFTYFATRKKKTS